MEMTEHFAMLSFNCQISDHNACKLIKASLWSNLICSGIMNRCIISEESTLRSSVSRHVIYVQN